MLTEVVESHSTNLPCSPAPRAHDSWMFEEHLHSPIPRFPNVKVHITGFIKEIFLSTEVKVAEKKDSVGAEQ